MLLNHLSCFCKGVQYVAYDVVLMCRAAFEQLTEAAEVLLDHGATDVYSWTKKQAEQHAQQGPQPPPAQYSKHKVAQHAWQRYLCSAANECSAKWSAV